MKLVNADDMFEYMKSEDGAIQLGHSSVRFLDVKRVIESVPTVEAIPVEWLRHIADDDLITPPYRFYAQAFINMWAQEKEAVKW
ncbi:MAG: hypothetical protein J6W84_01720 [Bacteroidales bacterium]|nr:hypothetical protein [Bacteroidales bacterium]